MILAISKVNLKNKAITVAEICFIVVIMIGTWMAIQSGPTSISLALPSFDFIIAITTIILEVTGLGTLPQKEIQ